MPRKQTIAPSLPDAIIQEYANGLSSDEAQEAARGLAGFFSVLAEIDRNLERESGHENN